MCADDFSLNAEVNAGILDVLSAGRLSAVSCMTQAPTWPHDAQSLLPYRGRVDIGLHVNFTQALSAAHAAQGNVWSLPTLMVRALFHCLPLAVVRRSISEQLDAFEQAMGGMPDFIDGHQHVHVFPQIRACLLAECVRRYPDKKPWIRSLVDLRAGGGLKARVLQGMGADACHQQFAAQGFAHNSGFAGLYNLQADANFDVQMRNWLHAMPVGGLIMCHPARALVEGDAHPAARVAEYQYFMSDAWTRALHENGVVLQRGTDIFSEK